MKKTILPTRLFAIAFTRIFILTALCCSISLFSTGQCFASSTVTGSAAVNDAAVGSLNFSNTSNSLSNDNNPATATALVSLFTGSTRYLKVTGFGFSIPSYASICGIQVEIEKKAGGLAIGAWVHDNAVRIVKTNAVAGTDHSVGGDWSTSDDVYTTYGGAADLWGTTFTPAQVNAADFGVALSANLNGLLFVFPSAQIDNVKVTVYYNPILPVKLVFFNSTLKNNISQLAWETATEEDNEYITLQRSIAGQSQWTDLASFETHNSSIIKKYNYSDHLDKAGSYAYRLRITNRDLQDTWSEIKTVAYKGGAGIIAYPNPARDHIILENINDRSLITINNMAMQRLNLPVQLTGEHTARISTDALPKGLYFITVDNQNLKFFKE